MKYAGVIVGVLLRLFLFSRVREALRIKPEMLFLIMLVKRGCFRMVLPVLLGMYCTGNDVDPTTGQWH